MESKTTVCLLLVLLSGFQASNGSIFSETIAALERAVQSYINTTLVTAHDITASVEKGVMQRIVEAENTISRTIQDTLHLASAVRECSSQASKELSDITENNRAGLRDCIHLSMQEITSAVDEFGKDVREINQAVGTSFFNFTSCGLNIGCQVRSLMEAHRENSEIRFNIANHILDVERAALVARRNGTECVQKVTASTRTELEDEAAKIIACLSSSSSTSSPSKAQ